MKLKIFTKKEWRKYKKKQRNFYEHPLKDAYDAGILEGRKETNAVLAAALFQLLNTFQHPEQSLGTIHVRKDLIGMVEYRAGSSWTSDETLRVEVYTKELLPD